MSDSLPPCPNCGSEYAYQDQSLLICPECAHEWNPEESGSDDEVLLNDAVGNALAEGDKVTLIKDLKDDLKGKN